MSKRDYIGAVCSGGTIEVAKIHLSGGGHCGSTGNELCTLSELQGVQSLAAASHGYPLDQYFKTMGVTCGIYS